MARGLLDPLADARGVDEAPGLVAEGDQLVDRVDGGAGRVVDDDPVLLGQLVEQRGLADVGLADDRDAARAAQRGVFVRRRLGQGRQDGVEHVARAAAVHRGDRPRLAESEVPETVGLGLHALVVDLVGGQHDRLAGGAQDLDHGLVGVGDADGGVDDEQHRVGQVDRDLGLGADRLGQAAGVRVPAAGVDDREGAAVPGGVVVDPVTGDAGDVLHDGLAAADDPVDQGGLADVRAADDREHRHRTGRVGGLRRGLVRGARVLGGSVSHRGSPWWTPGAS